MPGNTPVPSTPLSENEYETLAEFLEAHSPFDTDGLLGVLHAVGVAPSMLPPSAWVPVVFPNGFGDRRAAEIQQLLGLLLRLHNEVLDALSDYEAMMPEADDVAACESVAAGYAAGAEIDPEWIGNDDRWTFASPLAYLGRRLDLVPLKMLADIERNLDPDPKVVLCRDMAAMVRAAKESFEKARRQALPPLVARNKSIPHDQHVGRNDPCPCGSGKKYKRCCIGRVAEVAAR